MDSVDNGEDDIEIVYSWLIQRYNCDNMIWKERKHYAT